MGRFSDALNKPLPSQMNDTVLESVEDEITELAKECGINLGSSAVEGCGREGCGSDAGCEGSEEVDQDDIDDLDGDDDIDDLSEEDLAALDAELSDDSLDSFVPGDDEEVDLSPEEEIEADDMMKVGATSLLINDELSTEEKVQFIESDNGAVVAVNEGFLTEADVNDMANNCKMVSEKAKYNNKMIIRLDIASKKKQLKALAINVSAAAHHDPDYIKLKKVMKMRKILRAKLAKKYNSEAEKRMKVYFARLKGSKSKVLSNIGSSNS